MLVNAQTEDLFGYRREELLGQPVELLCRNGAARPIWGIGGGSLSSRWCDPWGREWR